MMTAASMLLGLTLDDGWTVVKHKAKSPNGTGGTFSESYEVVRADQRGFLSDRLRMVVAARRVVIQARDVDPKEPWPDGRDRTQDEALPV